jgi:hypothetical protein
MSVNHIEKDIDGCSESCPVCLFEESDYRPCIWSIDHDGDHECSLGHRWQVIAKSH